LEEVTFFFISICQIKELDLLKEDKTQLITKIRITSVVSTPVSMNLWLDA
jgi:hypothetical protein